MTYCDGVYGIAVPPGVGWELQTHTPAANRNAVYRCVEVRGDAINLSLIR